MGDGSVIAMPKRWGSTSALLVLLAVGPLSDAEAHGTRTPHQLVMIQASLDADSLRVTAWVERPTAMVAAEFREAFVADRQQARDQDARFRQRQWATMAEALHLRLDGVAVPSEAWVPARLANNGRGGEETFFYVVQCVRAVGDSPRLVIDLDNRVLLEQKHVFLSLYAEAEDGWRVSADSATEVLKKGTTAGSANLPTGTTWSHDRSLRQWHLVFEKGRAPDESVRSDQSP